MSTATDPMMAGVFLRVLMREGETYELRIVSPYKAAGYFDDPEKLASTATRMSDGTARDDLDSANAAYVTLNPVDPAIVVERGYTLNKEVRADREYAGDAHILHRCHLLIDIDPIRDPNESSTDEERDVALVARDDIQAFLPGKDWPEPAVTGMSGNGASLIYRVDLPNDAESKALVEAVLQTLAERFDTEIVTVDRKVANAARITKVRYRHRPPVGGVGILHGRSWFALPDPGWARIRPDPGPTTCRSPSRQRGAA